MPYLSLADYIERSAFEASDINEFFTRPTRVGTFAKWEKALRSRKIDDKLRRRYAVPFGIVAPAVEPDPALVPDACKDWLTAYLDQKLTRARRNPGAEVEAGDADTTSEAKEATQEIENAANANEPPHGELPLRADLPSASGVTLGGPMVVAYNTPYGFFDDQQKARDEGGW